jgi:hypothetical protein
MDGCILASLTEFLAQEFVFDFEFQTTTQRNIHKTKTTADLKRTALLVLHTALHGLTVI